MNWKDIVKNEKNKFIPIVREFEIKTGKRDFDRGLFVSSLARLENLIKDFKIQELQDLDTLQPKLEKIKSEISSVLDNYYGYEQQDGGIDDD